MNNMSCNKSLTMKKVFVQPGCITCGVCEFIAPDIFQVTDISHVRSNAPLKDQSEQIKQAAIACPVQVITYEE